MATPTTQDRAFFGHPRGLSTLFFTEMWERFSYYGMRALLLLYMTAPLAAGGLGFDAAQGGAIYGLYTSMVYMATLPGGWIADRLIGPRRAVLYGGIIIAAGHFSMAVPSLAMFYLGLFLIVIGQQDVRMLTPDHIARLLPAVRNMQPGVFCFNPPYGVRIGAEHGDQQLLELYADMGRALARFEGWRAACFVANPQFVYAFGHQATLTKPASNANLSGLFLVFQL